MSVDAALDSPEIFECWQDSQQRRNSAYNDLLRKAAECRRVGDTSGEAKADEEARTLWFGK